MENSLRRGTLLFFFSPPGVLTVPMLSIAQAAILAPAVAYQEW